MVVSKPIAARSKLDFCRFFASEGLACSEYGGENLVRLVKKNSANEKKGFAQCQL